MVIIRDNAGNIIGREASARYVFTRTLRRRHEQALCDNIMGIVREEPLPAPVMRKREWEANHPTPK